MKTMTFIEMPASLEGTNGSGSNGHRARTRPSVHGGGALRGLMGVPHSTLYEGRFGRMFRSLPPLEPSDIDLDQLAETILETEADPAGDNPDIPAGYTYLGQFIDHDITFDPTSRLERQNDPDALQNFRTPRFDLDSVYGSGPADDPYLYQSDGVRLLVGRTSFEPQEDDCPRNTPPGEGDARRALIGDPRNDENIIVNQLHLAIIKYHNQVVDDLEAAGMTEPGALFEEARWIVRWHYQWMVVHDFLNRIVGQEVIDDILKFNPYTIHSTIVVADPAVSVRVDRRFYHWRNKPFMPVEFAGAAYRFGHSMVRPAYDLNGIVKNVPIFAVPPSTNPLADLRGFRERPRFWELEWRRYFDFPESGADLQLSRKIDTTLSIGLGQLPFAPDLPSLAARNLRRGKALGLPSGQWVARAMGLAEGLILSAGDLGLPGSLEARFGDHTPLWYYVLKEAEVLADGRKLGPVGGRIVAEVFLGLLDGDPLSYISVHPRWQPTANQFGASADGVFTMPDLLRYAGVKITDPAPVGPVLPTP